VATFHAVDLLQHAHRQCLRHRLRGIVRRDRHLGVSPQRAFDRQRLGRKHIEDCARQRAFLERGQDGRREAEKKAAGLPPKLTVPMILFFLPVLFIVILGPAGIRIMEMT
jgi:hypothetical protein